MRSFAPSLLRSFALLLLMAGILAPKLAHAACSTDPSCCPGASTTNGSSCNATSTVNSVTASVVNTDDIRCTMDFTWNFNTMSCGLQRTVRFCTILQDGDTTTCPGVVSIACEDVSVSSGNTVYNRDFDPAAGKCYYCKIYAYDIQGAGCSACGGSTCTSSGSTCGTSIGRGTSACQAN